ncbi:MAG: hypothetical protein DMD82_02310 [Candidatus Rokuibacteriota bacterium]|nr:MAG: hypothetical protein DMD82_02310 [Candidatus Rokubacteria bacterium]
MVSRAQVLSPMVEAKAALRLGPVTRDALARTVRGRSIRRDHRGEARGGMFPGPPTARCILPP